MMSLYKITVNDIIYFAVSKGYPVSGLAVGALMDGLKPWTELEEDLFDPETYKEIIAWKEANEQTILSR